MLISFSVTNYRSIKSKATLSMLPVRAFKELPGNIFRANDKYELLRSSVIYGANASGKSNLVKAIEDFCNYVENSIEHKLNQPIKIYDPYLLDIKTEQAPSEFQFEFIGEDKIYYNYYVKLNSKKIIEETLNYYPKGQNTCLFSRKENKPIKYCSVIKGERKSIEARLLQNQLFLTKAINENITGLGNAYNFFTLKITNIISYKYLMQLPFISDYIAKFFNESDKFEILKLYNLIKSCDTGIMSFASNKKNDIKYIYEDVDMSKTLSKEAFDAFKNATDFEFVTYHNLFDGDKKLEKQRIFNLERESSGTRSLFFLALSIIESLDNGSIFIIDEFEQNLHPLLVDKLISLFHSPETNKHNAQLIFTTHNASLMDNEIFRRDQIWFTEKDEKGETVLYSMSDIDGVRNNIPYDKWYMSGRFGATPIVNDLNEIYRNDTKKKK
jgi:AAA15 family ATPase/GTPase